jgi:hypothetical protein
MLDEDLDCGRTSFHTVRMTVSVVLSSAVVLPHPLRQFPCENAGNWCHPYPRPLKGHLHLSVKVLRVVDSYRVCREQDCRTE